jgi:hypothetical protein
MNMYFLCVKKYTDMLKNRITTRMLTIFYSFIILKILPMGTSEILTFM